jgi:transposase
MHAPPWSSILSDLRTPGTPSELEHRRRLAVPRVLEGYSTEEVADFLGVDGSTVRRGVAAFRDQGDQGLVACPVPGRPRKLTATQEKIARRWLTESPLKLGFATARWTGPRLADLIQQELGIEFPPQDLNAGMRGRGFTPQKPPRVPRGRDPEALAKGLATQGPRIKKTTTLRTARSRGFSSIN